MNLDTVSDALRGDARLSEQALTLVLGDFTLRLRSNSGKDGFRNG